MRRGRFIVLDGPDGCGKSTQASLLARLLKRSRRKVVEAKDPGTTPVGKEIRKILLERKDLPLSPVAELLLYLAARAQLVREAIYPAIERGKWVVCDRWSTSTIAYQGYGPGRSPAEIQRIAGLCRIAEQGIEPDLTILLDLPAAAGMRRIRRARDRIEGRPIAYHWRVRKGFLRQAEESGLIAVLDAREPERQVALRIEALVEPLLEARR